MQFTEFLEANGFIEDELDYEESWSRNGVWGQLSGEGIYTSAEPHNPVSYVWTGEVPKFSESFTKTEDGWLYQTFEQEIDEEIYWIHHPNNGPTVEKLIPINF